MSEKPVPAADSVSTLGTIAVGAEHAVVSWLVKGALTYASRLAYARALPHWQRLTGKRRAFDDPKDVLAAAVAGDLPDGTLVEVAGLLSKYTFDYSPHAAAPFYLSSTVSGVVERSDGGGQGSVSRQRALAACGENPVFPEGAGKLFYLYRPVFKAFPSRFDGTDAEVAEQTMRKYKALYQQIPLIGPPDLVSHSERRNNIVARACHLPYEVMAEMFGTSKAEFDHGAKSGRNVVLRITEELVGDVKLHAGLDSLQTTLWTGLFAEFYFPNTALPGTPEHERLLSAFQMLLDDTAQATIPGAGPKLSGDQALAGATRAILRTDFKTVGMHVWSFSPLYAVYQAPLSLALHMASDLRADPIRDEQLFYSWVAQVAAQLPALLRDALGGTIPVEVEFVSNFSRARASGLAVLDNASADAVARVERFRHTMAWLRSK